MRTSFGKWRSQEREYEQPASTACTHADDLLHHDRSTAYTTSSTKNRNCTSSLNSWTST